MTGQYWLSRLDAASSDCTGDGTLFLITACRQSKGDALLCCRATGAGTVYLPTALIKR